MSEYYKDPHKYDDIINMPYKKSQRITNMSLHDRAAQFGAFEALTGHEEAIEETAKEFAIETVDYYAELTANNINILEKAFK